MDLYAFAASLCSRRECAPTDVAQKLAARGATPDEVDAILMRLREEHFLDDGRYLRAFIHDHAEYQLWGRQMLRQALRAKGFDASRIDRALEEEIQDEAYAAHLLTVLRRKARTLRPLPAGASRQEQMARRQKLFRAAAAKGYEPHLIATALDACGEDGDADGCEWDD